MDRLVKLLRASRRVLVFTGAGVSTGSGIPDFRGPQGVWKTRQPVLYQDFMTSEEARVRHWEYKLEQHEHFAHARPNAAHQALVALERRGILEVLVTQNIDGLHQDAGSRNVIELHGTNRWVECQSCHKRSEPDFETFRRERRCPRCPCGGFLKSATISFGQQMPVEPLQRAVAAAEACDLAISIGSTLEVHPAASVPLRAVQLGRPYAIINRGPTAQDELATVRLEGDVTQILPALIETLGPKQV